MEEAALGDNAPPGWDVGGAGRAELWWDFPFPLSEQQRALVWVLGCRVRAWAHLAAWSLAASVNNAAFPLLNHQVFRKTVGAELSSQFPFKLSNCGQYQPMTQKLPGGSETKSVSHRKRCLRKAI